MTHVQSTFRHRIQFVGRRYDRTYRVVVAEVGAMAAHDQGPGTERNSEPFAEWENLVL